MCVETAITLNKKQTQTHKKHTNIKTETQRHKYIHTTHRNKQEVFQSKLHRGDKQKHTNAKTETQIHKHKDTNINIQTQRHKQEVFQNKMH